MEALVQYCRICARIDKELKFPISTVSQVSQETIEDMLIYCTQLEVTPYDGLPQQVCAACMNSLNAAFFFRKLCYKSDATLKDLRRDATVEYRHSATPSPPPPAPELVVLLEKMPIPDTAQLIFKNENIDQDDELYEPELDYDDPDLDEDYTPDDGGDVIEQTTSSTKESEDFQKPTYVCRSLAHCSFVTTSLRKMEDHGARKGHPEFVTESVINGPDDSCVYVCKYEKLCEYRTTNKNNFERHVKKLNHSDFIKVGDNTKRPGLFKCKECDFEHHKQNEFNKHQLQSNHRLYSVQDQPFFFCPKCNSERKNYNYLIRHMMSCVGIDDLEEIKRLADESLASQSAKETIKTEVELFDLVASIEDSEEASASHLEDSAVTSNKPDPKPVTSKKTSGKSTTPHLYVCRHKFYCDFETDTLSRLKQHQELAKHPLFASEAQTSSDSFKCTGYSFCKYQTTPKYNFTRHQTGAKHDGSKLLENQTSRKVYKCQECEFQHNKSATFKLHQAEQNHALFTSAFELFFACPNCDLQSSKYSIISEHMGGCTEKRNPPAEGSEEDSDVPDCTTTSRRQKRKSSASAKSATSNISRESSPELDIGTISEANRDQNSWVVRCDFCNYGCTRDKISNAQRHVSNKCRLWQYQDETQDIFAGNSPRNVYNTLDEISTLTASSGKRLLPRNYEPELFDSTTTNHPPVKLVTSVLRYGWWLVLSVRGFRCCGCSMFFEDEDSLQKHRDVQHPAVRLATSKHRSYCEQCFRVFVNQEGYDYHLQLQHSAKLIYCITCSKLLISNTAWVAHCGLCHVSTRQSDDVQPSEQRSQHGEEVNGEKRNSIEIKEEPIELIPGKRTRREKGSRSLERYRCPRCAFRCAKLAGLRTHLVKHDAVSRFACRICNVSYGTRSDLQQHKRRTHDFKQEAL